MAETFETHLSVDKSIVEILSKSNYQRNFSHALREMVSNAYDADATSVTIDTGAVSDSIVIEDNGSGMTRDDLDYYLRIAGKRREKLRTTRFNRKRIGQFGVGFLAVFPFSKRIKIVTTTAGSSEVVTAEIPAADFFRRVNGLNVEDLLVKGVVDTKSGSTDAHYTKITLVGLTEVAKASISRVLPPELGRRSHRVLDWTPLDRLRWELQDELPLAFPQNSPFRDFFAYSETDLIEVVFDGEPLKRNDIGGDLLDSGDIQTGQVKARFAIGTEWKAISPVEMRHIKVRLNNVGVGARTDFDIARVRPYSHLAWITGELHIDEGLSDAITVGRDSLLSSPAVEALQQKMAEKVRRQAAYLESVEKSRKTISKQVAGGKQRQVGATKEVIAKSIKRLEDKGFRVRMVPRDGRSDSAPIEVDRTKKLVTIVENHPSFLDEIQVAGIRYRLLFSQGPGPAGRPCVVEEGGAIRVFTDTGLFASTRYGELLLRFCILATVAKKESRTVAEMYDFIVAQMDHLFVNYK